MKAKAPSVLLLAGLLFGGAALAMPSAENSDAVLPNSPLKERGYPDAGRFNPVGGDVAEMGVAPAVYLAPAAPFGFIDAPPSVNRLAGVIWLSHKLYPQAAKGDLHRQIADFYALFYGPRPDSATVSALLGD